MAHGQRFDHVGDAVFFMQVFQNPLIDGTADVETEIRVETIAHVREILMAQKLDEHGRNLCVHHFAIRFVAKIAAGPCRLIERLYVADNLIGDNIGKAFRRGAYLAAAETVAFGIDDRHRAYGSSRIGSSARIGMECEREIDRNSQSFLSRKLRRTSGKIVDPQSTALVVVLIVVLATGDTVNRRRYTGPLHPIPCTLGETRIVADSRFSSRSRTADIAHSSAYSDGIGGDNLVFFRRNVGEFHRRAVALACGKGEGAEIYPGASAYVLVDFKLLASGKRVDCISRIAGAVGERGIAHIDCIVAAFGKISIPRGCRGFRRIGHRGDLAHRTHAERIVAVAKDLLFVAEALDPLCGCPFVLSVFLVVVFLCETAVHVDDYFLSRGVALARGHHIGSRVFKHRDQIGEHVGLRIEILHGSHQACALPHPAVFVLIEIAAVALP